jgi:hypothetical protein
MPVASGLASERCGSSPNSGQSSSRPSDARAAVSGMALAGAVGAETSAGALLPQALSSAHSASVMAGRDGTSLCTRWF